MPEPPAPIPTSFPSQASLAAVVTGPDVRFTVVASRMIPMEYPIGFSGDSIVTWATLEFQPYFTATASNAAFGWWSHDIGGHCV